MSSSTRLRRSLIAAAATLAAVAALAEPAPPARAATPTCGPFGTGYDWYCYDLPSVTINASGAGTPYPAAVQVSGATGVINYLSVSIRGFSHERPDDVDIMLVGPHGTASVLMSDVGGTTAVSDVDLYLSDPYAGGGGSNPPLPDDAALTGGWHGPTDATTWGDDNDPYAAPAPASAIASLAAFSGIDPNGTWRLFVVDDESEYAGSIDSWTLLFTMTALQRPPQPRADTFNLVTKQSPPPALLTLNAGNRYLLRDPASARLEDPEGDAQPSGEVNAPTEYEDLAPLAGEPRSVVRGDWDRGDATHTTGASDGEEVLVVNADGSAVLLDDASAKRTGAATHLGGYQVLTQWSAAWAIRAAAFLDWYPGAGHAGEDIVLLTNPAPGTWELHYFGDSGWDPPAASYAALDLANLVDAAGQPFPWPTGVRPLDLVSVPGSTDELILAVAYPGDELRLVRVYGNAGGAMAGRADNIEWNGLAHVAVIPGLASAALRLHERTAGGPLFTAVQASSTATTDTSVYGGILRNPGWSANGTFVGACPEVAATEPSVAIWGGSGTRPLIGCVTTEPAGSAGSVRVAVRSWQMNPPATAVTTPVSEIKGQVLRPTLHYLLRTANTAGTPQSPTGLWQVGFVSQEGTGTTKLRIAGLEQAVDAGGIPVIGSTPHLTPPRSWVTADAAYAMTPVDLADRVVMLDKIDDVSQVVTLAPIPQVLLAAPPKVSGLDQQTALAPAYTTGTMSGTGTGTTHELEQSGILRIEARTPVIDLGVEVESRISFGMGYDTVQNFVTRIEDFYIGSTEDDAVVVYRTTMWMLRYRILESSDGLGVGTIVQFLMPRTTVLAVDTLTHLEQTSPEIFAGTMLNRLDWDQAFPHVVGNPGTYVTPGLGETGYCDADRTILRSLPHEVVEGDSTTEGARVSISTENTTTETRTAGISVDVIGGAVGINAGYGFGYTGGTTWSTTIGTSAAFEGYVGNIPYVVDGFDESYGWQMFVCKRHLGPLTVWSTNYSVGSPGYQGRGGYVPLGSLAPRAPVSYDLAPQHPLFRWTGGGAVDGYEVEVRRVGSTGAFDGYVDVANPRHDVAAGSVQSYATPFDAAHRLLPGATYKWRVSSHGFLGDERVSGWSYFVVGTDVQDSAVQVRYDGWTSTANPVASGGSYRSAAAAGAKATFAFTGKTFGWITRRAPDQGKALVTIDGVKQRVFELYAPTTQNRVRLDFAGLGSGDHRAVITVTGTKRAASRGTRVAVDAFVAGAGTSQDTATAITWGGWRGTAAAGAYGGTYRSANTAGSAATLRFTGRGVSLITAKGPGFGRAQVLVDGMSKGTVDLYRAGGIEWNVALRFAGLRAGDHTITVTPLGTKSAASTGTAVPVDGFVVQR